MFTTKSVSRPEPAIDGRAAPRLADCAVLLVGHGSSKRPAASLSLERHATALRASGGIGEVHTVSLIGGRTAPGEVLQRIGRKTIAIVPMMMCDGWTTREVIPEILGLGGDGPRADGRRIVICGPVGLHPDLARLIAERAADATALTGAPTGSATLLLIAHGSTRNAASHDATELQAGRLRSMGRFRAVATAYLEQAPRLAEVVAGLIPPVVAVGLFAAPGQHATRDVAAVLNKHPAGGISDLGPIGDDAAIPRLLLQMVESHLHGCVDPN